MIILHSLLLLIRSHSCCLYTDTIKVLPPTAKPVPLVKGDDHPSAVTLGSGGSPRATPVPRCACASVTLLPVSVCVPSY